jgi:hypothetical protein
MQDKPQWSFLVTTVCAAHFFIRSHSCCCLAGQVAPAGMEGSILPMA